MQLALILFNIWPQTRQVITRKVFKCFHVITKIALVRFVSNLIIPIILCKNKCNTLHNLHQYTLNQIMLNILVKQMSSHHITHCATLSHSQRNSTPDKKLMAHSE